MRVLTRHNVRLPQKFIWFWFVLTTGMGLAGFLLFFLNAGTPVPASWGAEGGVREGAAHWLNSLQQHLVTPALICFLGALILHRRPGHRIGQMLVFLGVIGSLATLVQEWAVYGFYTLQKDLPFVALSAWITNWIWVVVFAILMMTAALFPDGHFPSRRWGWIVYSFWLLFLVPTIIGGMIETPMSSAFQMPNPFITVHPKAFYDFFFNTGVIGMPTTAVAVLISGIVRFRRSQARERHQMKWLLFGVAIMAFLTVVGLGIEFGLESNLGALMVNAAFIGPALGVGIALLRHQLYDIDILIRRTLQYSLLTGLLALIYFGTVVLLQQGVGAMTGRGDSPVITVISTLAIAALFNPLRRRVQDFIDRRFYRKKYNAEQALAQFAAVARDEVELDKLTTALIHVVEETMQPEKVSLWLVQGKSRE